MGDVKWIKIVTDIFDNRKIKQIEKMPEGDSIIVIWVKLLCLAGATNDRGLIYFTKEIPYTDDMLATEFNRPIQTVKLALKTFVRFNMVELIDDIYHISSWEKYQSVDRMEQIREGNRRRVAEYRERKRLSDGNVTCSVTVTDCNAIDKDKDKEKDIDKERKKEERKKPAASYDLILDASPLSEAVRDAMRDFIQMRKLIKAPLTNRALTLLVKKLAGMTSDPEEQIEILNRSIENSWKGIFPLHGNEEKKAGRRSVADDLEKSYDMMSKWAEG